MRLSAPRIPPVEIETLDDNQREALAGLKAAIEADPRLQLDVKPETQFYAEQSEALATFIRILGLSLSVIFSIGAIVGAMITMFAAVAQRVGEIGTLRALGFRRGAVLVAFLAESLLLSLVGGVVGLAAPTFRPSARSRSSSA